MPLRLIAAIDTDHDGQLSEEEIARVHEALKNLDVDGDGGLNPGELGWWPRVPPARPIAPVGRFRGRPPARNVHRPNRSLAQRFMDRDKDGDSRLAPDELPEHLRGLASLIDVGGEGHIEAREIARLETLLSTEIEGSRLRDALVAQGGEESADAVRQVRQILENGQRVASENEQQIASAERWDWALYLLTVGAMLVSVISFGHLLTTPPPNRGRWSEVNASPDATRAVHQSLALICVLSVIDLLWTTGRAGQFHFRELNPLGSQLLLDGASPLAFKMGTLLASVLLLYALRRFRGAQLASWWMCMVCTLLTFRWIVLDSACFS